MKCTSIELLSYLMSFIVVIATEILWVVEKTTNVLFPASPLRSLHVVGWYHHQQQHPENDDPEDHPQSTTAG